MLTMTLRLPASISFCMASRYLDISGPTVRRPSRSRMAMPSRSLSWISRLMRWRPESAACGEFFRLYTKRGSGVVWRQHANSDRHFDADLGFDGFNGHHFDGVPGAAIEKRAVGTFAGALLAADAEKRIDFDAPERRMIYVGNPIHAVGHRAVGHASGRTRAAGAALGDDGQFLGTLLARRSDALGLGLQLHDIGEHVGIMAQWAGGVPTRAAGSDTEVIRQVRTSWFGINCGSCMMVRSRN